jgi:YihY family inner membrane protein
VLAARALRRIDEYQRSRPLLAFPVAAAKKFGEDGAGDLAALIAYYGFFSLFPLLLVLVSVLGFVLHGHSGLQRSILDSALAQFPVIGDQLRSHYESLTANGVVLGIGTATALWAGLGVTQAAQKAMNAIWGVPPEQRPAFLAARVRGLLMLVVLGSITVASIILSGLGTATGELGAALRILSYVGSLSLNVVLFLLAFRVLTVKRLTWGEVLPGAVAGGLVWTLLQLAGTYFVNHQVKHATPVYGTFALVIGLLFWIYMGAQLTLFCAEVNAVRVQRLWPRSLLSRGGPRPGDEPGSQKL